jgi:flagella basal body P-ring formation protein FlgA
MLGASSKCFALESNKLQIEAGQEWLTMIQKTVSDRFVQMGYFDIEVPSLVSSPRWVACNAPVTKVRQINRPTGRVYLTLECLKPRWQSQTDVLVKAKRSVVVALRSLSHNTLIEPNDVSQVEIDWTTVGDDVVTDIESVVGKTLGRSIALGQVLTLNSVRQTAVIRNGELVRIEMVGPSFVIGGEGVALQQGSTGQAIRIKMKSGQVVLAVILRPGLVRVDLQ